jgi:LPXTG-motif cell wall-anchored protein
MTIKYSKSLALATAIALTSLTMSPALAEDPVVPVATTSVVETGTIHVLSRVINDNLGTKYPTDFMFNLKHWGTDVVGSPFIGAGNIGTTFVVEAGSYVVSTPIVDGYYGSWYNEGITNGFIQLEAGDVVTIVRIHNDNGIATVVIEEPVTEDGGVLPNTATPWYNYLLVGLLITAAGALGFRKFALSNK